MQFPVPQFTDVEDKIIGSLTIKQFGIMFAAGVIVFLAYSASKSILVAVFFFILFGVPALGLAFAKINGRPLYNTLSLFVRFFSSPKILVFHKEINNSGNSKVRDAETASKAPVVTQEVSDPRANLRKVEELLRTTSNQESEAAGKIH